MNCWFDVIVFLQDTSIMITRLIYDQFYRNNQFTFFRFNNVAILAKVSVALEGYPLLIKILPPIMTMNNEL